MPVPKCSGVEVLKYCNAVEARGLWEAADQICGKLWDCDKCCVTSSHGEQRGRKSRSQREMASFWVKLASSCHPSLDLITVISQTAVINLGHNFNGCHHLQPSLLQCSWAVHCWSMKAVSWIQTRKFPFDRNANFFLISLLYCIYLHRDNILRIWQYQKG